MKRLITRNEENSIFDMKPGDLVVIRLPYWAEDYVIVGSWGRQWIYMVAKLEYHSWCKDFYYKLRPVPVGKMENIGVTRSWYTDDIIPFSKDDQFTNAVYAVDSIEEGEQLAEGLNKELNKE